VLTGWATDFWLAFRQRVLANVFAIMTIPPLILVTAAGELVTEQDRRWARYAELSLLTMGLFVVGLLVFGRQAPASGTIPALLLVPLPFLLWAAVRLGPAGLCFCLLVVAGVSLSNWARPLCDRLTSREHALPADFSARDLGPTHDPGGHRSGTAAGRG
jgi:two-component system sensor kinase FixL